MKIAQKVTLTWRFRELSEEDSKSSIKLKIEKPKWNKLTKSQQTENSKSQMKKAQKVILNKNCKGLSEKVSKSYINLKTQRTKWKTL